MIYRIRFDVKRAKYHQIPIHAALLCGQFNISLRNALSQSQNGNYFVIKRQIAFDGQSKQRDAIITKRQKSNKNQIAAVKIPQNALLK